MRVYLKAGEHADTRRAQLALPALWASVGFQGALHIILQLQKGDHAGAMVFADWIPEPVAEELRKAGIFFVDAQGNAFIRKPPQVVVDIRGKKPERPLKAEPGRLSELKKAI